MPLARSRIVMSRNPWRCSSIAAPMPPRPAPMMTIPRSFDTPSSYPSLSYCARMAKQPRILTGQVAAIPGGGRGIGKETARAFIRQGIKVAIGDLDLDTAQRTAEELGGGTIALPLNVTDRAS